MILEDPIFGCAPALRKLREIDLPKSEHVRACLMEMSKMVFGLYKRVESLENQNLALCRRIESLEKQTVDPTDVVSQLKSSMEAVDAELKSSLEVVDNLKEEYISVQDFVNAAKWRDIKEAMQKIEKSTQKIVAMAEK
jgi:vacuolar-type H+-ATPase subunit I/STV1